MFSMVATAASDAPRRPLRIDISPRTLLGILVAVAAAYLFTQLWFVLVLVLVALVLAGTLLPAVRRLEAWHLPRWLALTLLFLAVVGGLFLIGLATLPSLVNQIAALAEKLPELQASFARTLGRSRFLSPLAKTVRDAHAAELLRPLATHAFEWSQRVLVFLGEAVTTLFLALYLLADRGGSQRALYSVVPRRYHLRMARILLNLETIVGGYVRGQLVTSALMMVFVFVLLHIMNVDGALALAVFAGITDVLPFIGALLVTTPAVLAALGNGIGPALVVLVALVAYQEFESRILVPRVYGRALRLPPAAVIVALLTGGVLLGVLGALLALPVAAALRMIIRELRVELPGDASEDGAIRARDERAEREYDARSAGAPPAEAAAIATELADEIRHADAGEEQDLGAAAEVPVTGGDAEADAGEDEDHPHERERREIPDPRE
jgi:predicted PurR-regulated permease PerM